MRRGDFSEYRPPIRVDGGIRAQSTRGDIGASWWSKRFLTVLESFALGSRLTRGRSYARKGQVLSLVIGPGLVHATVQGSRPRPYDVRVELDAYGAGVWRAVETALAAQAIFSARLLAGEMPAEIEGVFADAGAPLFPTGVAQLRMRCSCPDAQVPCKHLAAVFYLLAEAFDADPFEILHWRGRDRAALLGRLRKLRGAPAGPARPRSAPGPSAPVPPPGAAGALTEVTSAPLAETVDRFWVAPVPLPARPPTLDTDVTVLLRQLPPPPAAIGGAALVETLRGLYAELHQGSTPYASA